MVSGTGASGPLRVTFIERRGCHLCHAARGVVERVIAGHAVRYEVADVDAREDLRAAWGLEVPVLLLEGEPVFRGRVDEEGLRRRLAPYRRRAAGLPPPDRRAGDGAEGT